MVSEAESNVIRLGRPLAVKTKAADVVGEVHGSSYGKRADGKDLTARVMETGKKIGHTFVKKRIQGRRYSGPTESEPQ